MSEKISVELGNVQKTLFLPLWGRAVESCKPNPLLVDSKALEIMDRTNFDFKPLAQRLSPLSQAAWIIRSIYVDKVVEQFLVNHPAGAIVNIGCGMDTTFERIDNGLVKWFDLDLPDVITLRRMFITETERRRFISSSFLDNEWLENINGADGVLFISAGVFYYFEEAQIKNFLIRLADRFPGSEIVFDVCSPTGLKLANRAVIKNSGLGEASYLTWGLSSLRDLLAWDPRFKLIKQYYYFRYEKINLRMRLMGLISDLMLMQYMLHLGLGV